MCIWSSNPVFQYHGTRMEHISMTFCDRLAMLVSYDRTFLNFKQRKHFRGLKGCKIIKIMIYKVTDFPR
jgi:hypothetical protein